MVPLGYAVMVQHAQRRGVFYGYANDGMGACKNHPVVRRWVDCPDGDSLIPCYIRYILTKSINTRASTFDLLPHLLRITTIVKERMTRSKESSYPRLPLELSGALGSFHFEESTPTIGRESFDVDIVKDILEAENEDALVRDLAITSESSQETLSFDR
jgi:hypothetical protein